MIISNEEKIKIIEDRLFNTDFAINAIENNIILDIPDVEGKPKKADLLQDFLRIKERLIHELDSLQGNI